MLLTNLETMHYKEIQKSYSHISELILNNEILNAINILFDFANKTNNQYYHNKIEEIKGTYLNILQHSFSGIKDPERGKIYCFVQKSLFKIADNIKEQLLTEKSDLNIYKLKSALRTNFNNRTEKVLSLIKSITLDDELNQILKNNKINISSDSSEFLSRKDALKELFNYLWLTDNYKETENDILKTLCSSEKIPWHDKSLIVSAITLSLIRIFDKNKFLALLNFYFSNENQVWQRALVGILLGFYRYDKRLKFYPEIEKKILKLSKASDINKQIEAIIIQIFKSKDTEKITKQWEEEILPEMMKMQPKIEKELDIENILPDKFFEDKNPDWEKVFEDSPGFLDKLQDFSQMQIDGSDIFMSAFSKLKHFPYFNDYSGWFSPFYSENEAIGNIIGKEKNLKPFIEQLEKSHYMCNSDKYSFCLNLQLIPEAHKSMMMEMFNEEMKSMEEVAKDENLLNSFAITKSIFTQYIQDLYRFYKVHPNKNEFSDIFKWDFDINDFDFFNKIITDNQVTRNIAEFFLENHHYKQASDIFINIEKADQSNIELFEKIGYCYQKMGIYKKALEYYKKAELLDANKAWITKKIALCYRYLNEHENALEYYKQVEKTEPDNLYIQAYIGHTLMRLEKYEEALKYYFKVEYLAPSNEKIQHPIAWISFALGKFETAINYYKKILKKGINEFDLIHLGHAYWCANDLPNAIKSYKKAIKQVKGDFSKFDKTFKENQKYLEKHGISNLDINLMKDLILNSSHGQS